MLTHCYSLVPVWPVGLVAVQVVQLFQFFRSTKHSLVTVLCRSWIYSERMFLMSESNAWCEMFQCGYTGVTQLVSGFLSEAITPCLLGHSGYFWRGEFRSFLYCHDGQPPVTIFVILLFSILLWNSGSVCYGEALSFLDFINPFILQLIVTLYSITT